MPFVTSSKKKVEFVTNIDNFTRSHEGHEEGVNLPHDVEALATIAVDCGFKLHNRLGPGLLESVYEAVLCEHLKARGLGVERQKPIAIMFDGIALDEGFRADLLIEGKLLVELKSVERFAPIHGKQILTYLRLMNLPLGLLMNFGAASFREGIKRVANDYYGGRFQN